MTALSREFLRALRGTRSQLAFSRRIGYASKVAAEWESGRREPSAAAALSACARLGIDVAGAFARFNPPTAAALVVSGRGKSAAIGQTCVAAWLNAQRGRARASEIAERTHLSRSKLSRILSGKSGVSLGDFFSLVQATTARVTDLIAELVDVAQVPSAAAIHARVQASRELAFAQPWASATVALFETEAYRKAGEDSVEYVARHLRLTKAEAAAAIAELRRARLVSKQRGKYMVRQALTVDTRDRQRAARLRQHWARAATERLMDPGPRDLFSYNVFSVSEADYERIRELLKQSFREARATVAGSNGSQVAGLLTLQLVQF